MKRSTRPYADDAEMYRLFEGELFVAVVGDVMDTLGLQHQFLPPVFKPVDEKTRLLGRAMPVLEADIFPTNEPTHNPLMSKPHPRCNPARLTCRYEGWVNGFVHVWVDWAASSDHSWALARRASVADDQSRVSRAIWTVPREAERMRRACGIRTP